MRLALALVLATGCIAPQEPYPDPGPPSGGSGWTDPVGDPIAGCRLDSQCPGKICGRDGMCYPAANIREARALWTVDGEVASTASCVGRTHLFIRFETYGGDSFGFSPVPCKNGKFTVDKLPTQYTTVELGSDGASYGTTAAIGRDGTAMIDL